ncbi:MAG: hypothetical protein ACRD4M_05950 [Candidatus Acidiferrales bacterium]
MTTKQLMDGIVSDLLSGRPLSGIISDPAVLGGYLCNADGCRKPTGHYNYFVSWQHTPDCFRQRRAMIEQRDLFDREFLAALKIANRDVSSSRDIHIEIVMQGEAVRKAREAHDARNRKPLMADERRGYGAGEIDLGDIS